MPESNEARKWHGLIRGAVRECLDTWLLQSQAGSVTVKTLKTILARATVPILRQVEERPPELMIALLPSLVRTMLAAFVEVVAEQRGTKAQARTTMRAARTEELQATPRSLMI